MNKLLIICPTYKRAELYNRMSRTFYETQTCSDLITLTAKGSITPLVNSVDYSNYQYVGITNDDVVYVNEGWDKDLIAPIERKGYGISFGNDGTNNNKLPAICIMSTNIPNALGWLQYPKFQHLCGDMVWQYLGEKLNCLFYNKHVQIMHMHYLFGKGNKEDYGHTNSDEIYKKDNKTFKEWLLHQAPEDVQKIRTSLDM